MSTSEVSALNRLSASFIPPMVIDRKCETPLYRQISVWFQRAIIDGQLQPGQRVPSTRALAKALKISRIPVLSAYELLIVEGYFEPFRGAGTCVAQSIPDALYRSEPDILPDTIATAPESKARRPISRRATRLLGPAQSWLEVCRGCTDLAHFPIGIWSKLISRHAGKLSPYGMGYGQPMGYEPFREAVAEYLGAFRAVKCEPDQILVTTGAQQALQLSALVLLDAQDKTWIEDPAYPATHQALKAAGAQLVAVPVDKQGLSVECGIQMAEDARATFVTPSHQFPMGVTMSAKRRIELLNWASRNGAWIVEDDYDSEFRFNGNPIASLQGLDRDHRVIYVGTLSKVMFPALRLGFAVLPRDLIPGYLNIRNAADTYSSSVLSQMAMTDFIREGHFSRHIKRMRAVYMERRNALTLAINSQGDGLLEAVGDEAGQYLLALLPPGIDDTEVANELPQMGIKVNALSRCYATPPERGGIIIGYANVAARDIAPAVDTLKRIVAAHTARH
ncbi:MAG: PLP-dependent aminotransferase family protein [Terriglobia bacterium]